MALSIHQNVTDRQIRNNDTRGQTIAWLKIINTPMQCCALVELSCFTYAQKMFTEGVTKESFLSFLWLNQNPGGYQPFNFVYALTEKQFDNSVHQLFLECGCIQMGEAFPSQSHDPFNKIYIFRFDLKGAVGKYLDANGKPLIKKEVANATPTSNTATVVQPVPIQANQVG